MRAQSARVPPEWAGRPSGPMRAASYPFPCAGPCGAVCAAGTHAQPFRDYNMAGSLPAAGPNGSACAARATGACARGSAGTLCAARSRRILYWRARSCRRKAERVYAPDGAGYVHARDDFEARADKLPRLM